MRHLHEVVDHLLLGQVALALLLEQVAQVTTLCKVHDYVQDAGLKEGVAVTHDIGVVERCQCSLISFFASSRSLGLSKAETARPA